MKNGGLYKNVTMSLKTANIMVLCAIGLLVFCFLFAIGTAEKTTEANIEFSSTAEFRTE